MISFKKLSKSLGLAARVLTPLVLFLLFWFSNVLKLNELRVSKFIYNGICNNESMDGLGRIVCPAVPLEDELMFFRGKETRDSGEISLPVVISTTKQTDNVVINTDSSTPSSLYLILKMCSDYKTRENKPKIRLLDDLCPIISDSLENSDLIQQNHRNGHVGTNVQYDRELVLWLNVSSLLRKLPYSGKLKHVKLLSHSLNKNEIMYKVLNSISSYHDHITINTNNTSNNNTTTNTIKDGDMKSKGRSGCDRKRVGSSGGLNLLVTSDILSSSDDPFRLLVETAFPSLIAESFGTIQESVHRLFLSFPESSAALLHMRKIGFGGINFSSLEPEINRFTFLSVFLSALQLLLTYSFDNFKLYDGIIESSYSDMTNHWDKPNSSMKNSKDKKNNSLLNEFDDLDSRVFVDFITRRLGSFFINLEIKKRLFNVGNLGVKFTVKFLHNLILTNLTQSNVVKGSGIELMKGKLRESLTALGKFISFDFDNDGEVSFEEFTKGSIDMNDFVNDVISAVDSYGKSGLEKDRELQFVHLLKSQNTLYDKIIDEFIISDTDKNDSLSLDEFLELNLSTSIISNIQA
ncbi:putative integral membrane protein [Theileria parva strain Muguga]|uniref:EF-hand domain-containing protein n=1 Tax=Theileria parva TaxID=5875 RepID=Q4N426_THEPA|nr:putative integral membrane protein [Theileria parva strain Muguga]EAN33097.1 putative integral membrane protein [Theileria parva strain Muguga]|eukprot:XP_765380.1 hypothetical protein [Theileria parva strain Muguga]